MNNDIFAILNGTPIFRFITLFYNPISMENLAELSYESLQVLPAQEVAKELGHGMCTSREAPSFVYSAAIILKSSLTEYQDENSHRPIPTLNRFDS
jgi:hypothetical protein